MLNPNYLMMIEFIIDIYNQLIDLYQYFFGVPEGITYALFGSRKKKKAKKALRKAEKELSQLDNININDSIPGDGSNAEKTEFVTKKEPKKKDIPEVPFQPAFPYSGRQIILDSGRLHLNAKDDFLILMARKSISLSAGEGSINFDTNNSVIVNAEKIKLGIGKGSEHPLVYGDQLEEMFFEMAKFLADAGATLKDLEDSAGAESSEAKLTSQLFLKMATQMVKKIPLLKSKTSFTK